MTTFFSRRRIRNIVILLILLFVAIQFIRPEINNPPVTADMQAPPEVKAILRRSCYDCHSNETNLRWFDKIVPVVWQVKDHIVKGRKGLNFSAWDQLPAAAQNAKLWEAVNQTITGDMPLAEYTLVHRSAKISENDLQILKNYVAGLVVVQPSDSLKRIAINKQLADSSMHIGQPPVALNGISFMPDYVNWKAISTTDRYDNGTLRIIAGNDIAIKAIREKNTNPWPDGSAFAKIAWDALADSSGLIRSGAFKQVEFMIRDRQKYASTLGWGFARFLTPAMVPYGKSALFVSECVGCHRPMKSNDYVFTIPLNADTKLPGNENLKWIGPRVNRKDSTISIQYKSDPATLGIAVTWKQREDPHWFGGRIPGEWISVDTMTLANSKK
jgi:Haem-binding domain/Cytochrome P460